MPVAAAFAFFESRVFHYHCFIDFTTPDAALMPLPPPPLRYSPMIISPLSPLRRLS